MRMASPCAACRFATCKFPNLKKKFLGPPPSQILGTPLIHVSVGSVLEKQLQYNYVDTNEQALRIPQIVSDEIQAVISKLNNSSPGCDNIPPKIGKLFVDQYIEPLTYLINKSIAQGVFPDELKLAQVVPIFKAGKLVQVSTKL